MLESEQKGVEVLREAIARVPPKSGIYKMKDAYQRIIYVGKAVNLPQRLRSYTRVSGLSSRIRHMISVLRDVDFLVTETETEALLLEASLIKIHQPRYNILLRDDKTHPYLTIVYDHDYPRIARYRGKKVKQADYFGPFLSGASLDRVIEATQKLFNLRVCADAEFSSRARPCVEYEVKRCSGPCAGLISKEDYGKDVKNAAMVLGGKNRKLREFLNQKMLEASDQQRYETAALYRDKIRALAGLYNKDIVGNFKDLDDADFIGIVKQDDHACVMVFFVKGESNTGNIPFFFNKVGDRSEEDILTSFMMQFYHTNIIPAEIYTNVQMDSVVVLEKSLDVLKGKSEMHSLHSRSNQKTTKIYMPKRGNKLEFLQFVCRNAEESLRAKYKHSDLMLKTFQDIRDVFELDAIPERIEVYDNSHLCGEKPIGAMVVATPEGFCKRSYRRYNLNEFSGDDYQMLREVMARRLAKIRTGGSVSPDLMLIDGGLGHFGVVRDIMHDMQMSIPFVCMSKGVHRNSGLEQYHMAGRGPFILVKGSRLSLYLQNIRDEVHRFAIVGNRAARDKKINMSVLDGIPGVGKTRKKSLLTTFGSLEKISKLSVQELQQAEGVSQSVAERVYDFFHNR